ncbi:hypothetical protein KDM41_13890 [bacterium]|nr:hypothetical protein [bacterium]
MTNSSHPSLRRAQAPLADAAGAGTWDRRRLGIALVVTGLSLAGLLIAATAEAQGVVRAWGMGGAGTATARGLEAVGYNPANLAFSEGTTVGLAAAAADVHNNALSLDRYNEITGQYLDSTEKARLLDDIPASGLQLDADLSASALGFQTGPFAVSFSGLGAGQGNLDRDYFDLVLNGNQLGETVDFSNTWGEGYAVGSAAVSYGLMLREGATTRLSAGVNARYLHGIYEMHVTDAYGTLTTGLNDIAGEAYVATESSSGGSGYGLDLGLALVTDDGWQFGLAVDNVLAQVSWDRDVERQEMRVTAADVNLMNGDLDAAVSDADTTFATDGYTTELPRRARLGAARQFGSFMVAADYVQGFEDRGVTSTSPLVNTGVEWRLASFFQPRVGLSTGGDRGTSATVGVGIKAGPWRLDAAAVSRSGVTIGDNKGVGVALGSMLEF